MIPTGLWFRVYTSVVDSAKLQTLDPEIFKAWVNFCCVAKRHGDILPPDSEIAWTLRISTEEAARLRQALTDAKLIDRVHGGKLNMHDWEEWQKRSDHVSERVRKHRMKQAGNVSRNRSGTLQETGQKRYSNAAEPEPEPEPEPEECLRTRANAPFSGAVCDTKTEPSIPIARRQLNQQQAAWFAQFWQAYWHKIGKAAAQRKFATTVRTQETFTAVMDGIRRQTPEMSIREPRFIPHPATWLNQERWQDEPAPASQALIPINHSSQNRETFGERKERRRNEIFAQRILDDIEEAKRADKTQ
jgi:hypothetical protein